MNAVARDRPLLLLDIDGVLQPAGRAVPPGFERLEFADSIVVLNRAHGVWLRELAEEFEMVWASTWAGTANELIGTRLGLPPIAHIELGTLGTDGTRKLRAVQDFVGDRPFAWVDDELYEDAHAWATDRGAPTLLVRTQAYVGLTAAHIEALRSFAADLASAPLSRLRRLKARRRLGGVLLRPVAVIEPVAGSQPGDDLVSQRL